MREAKKEDWVVGGGEWTYFQDRESGPESARGKSEVAMKREVDVLVIGAGSVGINSAFYLNEQGRHVEVVDKGEVCSGSSHGNAGWIVPSHSVPLAAPGTSGNFK